MVCGRSSGSLVWQGAVPKGQHDTNRKRNCKARREKIGDSGWLRRLCPSMSFSGMQCLPLRLKMRGHRYQNQNLMVEKMQEASACPWSTPPKGTATGCVSGFPGMGKRPKHNPRDWSIRSWVRVSSRGTQTSNTRGLVPEAAPDSSVYRPLRDYRSPLVGSNKEGLLL